MSQSTGILTENTSQLSVYVVYLQLTDACNEVKAGIYYPRRKMELASGSSLGSPGMEGRLSTYNYFQGSFFWTCLKIG